MIRQNLSRKDKPADRIFLSIKTIYCKVHMFDKLFDLMVTSQNNVNIKVRYDINNKKRHSTFY